jgi:hypothetical protein
MEEILFWATEMKFFLFEGIKKKSIFNDLGNRLLEIRLKGWKNVSSFETSEMLLMTLENQGERNIFLPVTTRGRRSRCRSR